MLKLADMKNTDIVYDLGCGDGRIVIAAAKTYGARGVGIDIDPDRIREAKENAKEAGVENLVRFEENDLFQAHFRDATVVTPVSVAKH
jgi:cyclopropane fatty-acyl-phospholipid synthase-like methyltransferase